MLAYVLALVVGLGSFGLYMAAFFFPEVHRKNDFIWSGIGLFYALVLWVCAGRITGGVLLGQTASVALLGWLGWQTLTLRRQITPIGQQTALPTPEEVKTTLTNLTNPETLAGLAEQAGQQVSKLTIWVQTALSQANKPKPPVTVEPPAEEYVPLTPADFGPQGQPAPRAAIDPVIEPAIEADPWGGETAPTPTAPTTQPVDLPIPAQSSPPTTPTAQPAGGFLAGLGQQVQSLFKGGKPQESKSVYVRKQFREGPPEAETAAEPSGKPVYVRKQFRDSEPEVPAEPSGKPVYVRKQYREDTPQPKAKTSGKPVYVRKQYRDPEPEPAIEAETPVITAEVVTEVDTVGATTNFGAAEIVEEFDSIFAEVSDPPAAAGIVEELVEDTLLPADAVVEAEIAYEASQPPAEEQTRAEIEVTLTEATLSETLQEDGSPAEIEVTLTEATLSEPEGAAPEDSEQTSEASAEPTENNP